MASIMDRLAHAWNAFTNPIDSVKNVYYGGSISSNRPDRTRLTRGNERTIITAIYNRLALDAASISFQHARVDENNHYVELIDSNLNHCLSISANQDQTGRAFMQDVFMSLLDEGCVAIVPVETKVNPMLSTSIDITSLRVGKIVDWMPKHVRVKVYNEKTGNKEEIVLPKSVVAIVENPFYSVMNEPSSTAQRLIRKLALLDVVDEQSGSGKLDMIIQLPYVIKTEARKKQAEERRKEIETQLTGSKYGIAYTDGTEHITQLNRSLENNLLKQVEYLTTLLYSQLNVTDAIMNGSADEKTMTNYYSRVIEPLASAVVDEMKRKFLTKTAISQRQSIVFFRDPFKLVPVTNLADIADKFTRNEILSSNEVRQIIGMKPVNDQRANELRNKNINATDGQSFATTSGESVQEIPEKNLQKSKEEIPESSPKELSIEEIIKEISNKARS